MKINTKKLAFEATELEVKINRTRTKVMAAQPREFASIAWEGEVFGRVESFDYLGSVVCYDEYVRKKS